MMLAGSTARLSISDSPQLNGRSVGTTPERPSPTVADKLRELRAYDFASRLCHDRGSSLAGVLGRSRRPRLVAIRPELWHVLHTSWRLPYAEIGRVVERDHQSVIMGIRKHEQRLASEFFAPLFQEAAE